MNPLWKLFLFDAMHAVTWIQIGIMRDPGPEGNFFYLFSIFFLASGGRSPSLPRDFTVYTVTLLVLRVFHCERCRIRTRDHCLRRLERYQGKKLSEICKNVLKIKFKKFFSWSALQHKRIHITALKWVKYFCGIFKIIWFIDVFM